MSGHIKAKNVKFLILYFIAKVLGCNDKHASLIAKNLFL